MDAPSIAKCINYLRKGGRFIEAGLVGEEAADRFSDDTTFLVEWARLELARGSGDISKELTGDPALGRIGARDAELLAEILRRQGREEELGEWMDDALNRALADLAIRRGLSEIW
jgi:hypothetical protein